MISLVSGTWRKLLAAAAFVGTVLLIWLVAATVVEIDSGQQREGLRAQRAAERTADFAELCGRVNELPGRLAHAIALSDQLRQLTGQTTTTTVPADLTAEEKEQVNRLRQELSEVVRDLGRPIMCESTTTGAPR